MKKTIAVTGMTCGHCEARVEKAVSSVPGVRAVAASHRRGNIKITFDGDAPDDQAIARAVAEAGYSVA